MNNRYLKLLISSGIKALTGAAALAAAAAILKSDDKKEPQNSEKETPKPEKAPETAQKETAVPKTSSENAAFYAAKAAQAEKAAPQADISKQPENVHTENPEKTENSSPQTNWDKWEIIYRRFTNRPPIKKQNIYVPDYLWEIKTVEIPKISLTEKEAEKFGYSFRKKSKRIRITNYHGSEKSVIIPTYIGGMLVNEIGANAFTNSRAERVAIPDNIKKLGDSAFAESDVRFVIFGKGLREIPKMCFYNCKDLKIAAIPPLTEKLGEKAFYGCKSLKYIELPWELREIGEDCFCGSGLEGFAARFQTNFYPDGSAFANTPLHRNNGLVLYKKYDPSRNWDSMEVLLVGYNVNVNFKAPRVHLGRNSVCAPCRLDFSQCKYLDANRAFKYVLNGFVHVTVSENINPVSFPDYVDVQCSDSDYKGWYEKLEEDSTRSLLKLKINCSLCTHSLSTYNSISYFTEDLTLVPDNPYGFRIYDCAIRSAHLYRVEFAGKISPYWDSCIFDPSCISLHKVKWHDKDKTELVQFIPSGKVVRPNVHRGLLKAFCQCGFDGFFDPKIIENVFDNGIIRELSETSMPLSRREKILIAIEVLRSSPELYPNGTEKYSRFLKRHLNYAKKMCGKLRNYPEYLEFLDKFAPEKGDVQ